MVNYSSGRRSLAGALLIAVALSPQGAGAAPDSGPGGGDRVDKKIEDKIDDRIDDKIDGKTEDQIDDKVDGKVDDKVDDRIDDRVEDRSGRRGEDKADARAERVAETTADRAAARAMEDAAKSAFESNLDAADAAHRAEIHAAKDAYDAARRLDGADEEALKAEFETRKDIADDAYKSTKDTLKQEYEAARDEADRLENAARGEFADEGDAPARRRFEAELDGGGDRRARGEWLMLVNESEAQKLSARGYRLEAIDALPALGAVLMRASIEVVGDIGEAEAALRQDAPGAHIDYNHLYSYRPAGESTARRGVAPREALGVRDEETGRGLRIGVIDTRVNAAHEALAGAALTVTDFVPYDAPRPADHGTSVASILAGRSGVYRGLAPEAEIFQASVFFTDADGAATATTESIVKAIDWLAREQVGVINLSLAGPPNEILKGAIARAQARGLAIVAAVGNDGPAARPLYPAAYDGVIGVTAVAADKRVYRLANRGTQVDFAAPGVDVLHADGSGGYSATSGTSMATPFVAVALAAARRDGAISGRGSDIAPDVWSDTALQQLEANAEDLGARGRDPVYGAGLVRLPAR